MYMYYAQCTVLTVSWLTYFVRIDNMNVGRGFSGMRNIKHIFEEKKQKVIMILTV